MKAKKEPKNILTLEFSVKLSNDQKELVERWMDALKHQWNMGLSALEEFDRFYRWNSKVGDRPGFMGLCCPIREGEWDKESRQVAMSCPLNKDPNPKISSSSLKGGGACLGTIANATDDMPDFLKAVPSVFRRGMLAFLSTSWEGYISDRYDASIPPDKKRGKPRYKRRRDQWHCLYSCDIPAVRVDGDRIHCIPKIGTVSVPNLSRRWVDANGQTPDICTIKIIRRGDKFRIQLSGDLKRTYRAPKSDRAIGIDLGFIYAEVESDGRRSPLFSAAEERLEKRRQELQSALDAKIDHRLLLWLHHPKTNFEAVRQYIRVSTETWEKMQQCRSAGEVAQIIGQKRDKRYSSLRRKLPRSNAEKGLRMAIANLDRKMAKTRLQRDNKFAARITRKYGYIAIENGIQDNELRHRPEAIQGEDGQYEKNGASRQSETNKQLRSLAPGQKIAILEQRAKRYGRSFVKAAASGTTAECPCCGAMNEPSLVIDEKGDRPYNCSRCGWVCDQDINAAINMELRSFVFVPNVILTPWAERARVRSYQLEGEGAIAVNPSWRMTSEQREQPSEARAKTGRAFQDSGKSKTKKTPSLTPASRKNQTKVKHSKGAIGVGIR